MQIKANGGMFYYPLITRMTGGLVEFVEVIKELDIEAVDIVHAFHTLIRGVVAAGLTATGGRHGDESMAALEEACTRYLSGPRY